VSQAGSRAADLAWLAVASGYAGQAHLIRECTRLASAAPARARAAVAVA
jgi:hypothetical protein